MVRREKPHHRDFPGEKLGNERLYVWALVLWLHRLANVAHLHPDLFTPTISTSGKKLPAALDPSTISLMPVKALIALLRKLRVKFQTPVEREELVKLAKQAVARRSASGKGKGAASKGHVPAMARGTNISTKYDLLANIVHDSPPVKSKDSAQAHNPLSEGTYRVHVCNPVRTAACHRGGQGSVCALTTTAWCVMARPTTSGMRCRTCMCRRLCHS